MRISGITSRDLLRQNRHEYNLSDALLGVIDVALWDIRGNAAGLPIARMDWVEDHAVEMLRTDAA